MHLKYLNLRTEIMSHASKVLGAGPSTVLRAIRVLVDVLARVSGLAVIRVAVAGTVTRVARGAIC